ncbi:hypothetical protein [Marinobacter mobilis]|uniref:hypothetical protein n=1 Tax=Marinobacter mobilis TaxID=488533 RepID=UPI0035C66B3D
MTYFDSSGVSPSPDDDFSRQVQAQIRQVLSDHENRIAEEWGKAKKGMPLYARWAMALSGSATTGSGTGSTDDQ